MTSIQTSVDAMTDKIALIDQWCSAARILPVITIEREADILPLADALAAGGLRVLEITLRSALGLGAIRLLREQRPELIVGAGTVLDANMLEQAEAAGAQFIQTQYCFDIPRLRDFMLKVNDLGLLEGPDRVFILPGIGPLASARSARWIRENVPGVHIPDAVIARLEGAKNQKEEGKRLCMDLLHQIREIPGVSGAHIMAYRQEHTVAEIIEGTGVLEGRVPWYPGRDNPKELNPESPDALPEEPEQVSG